VTAPNWTTTHEITM